MKKFLIIILLSLTILTSGCLKRDTMEGINIYTTIYPVRYLIDTLYGDNAKIFSIYPNGIDIDAYKLSNKQLTDYSKGELFVFNSKSENELDAAVSMINQNKGLKIIDVANGMDFQYSVEELWLNPYNYLMMAGNIQTGLNEYITNPYLIKEIDDNFKFLQLNLSELDAEIKQMAENAHYDTLVVDNNALKFLEKYGLNIISLDEREEILDKTIEEVKMLLNTDKVKYIYTINDTESDIIKNFVDNFGAITSKLNSMKSIDGGVTNANQNYITVMKNNISLLQEELYK